VTAPRAAAPRDAFAAALLAWLNARLASEGVAITADTPLFAGGLLNSLRVLELIAWTERATGQEIPDSLIRMDHFRTVRLIAERFAGGDDALG
jgi:acyl carrier protein